MSSTCFDMRGFIFRKTVLFTAMVWWFTCITISCIVPKQSCRYSTRTLGYSTACTDACTVQRTIPFHIWQPSQPEPPTPLVPNDTSLLYTIQEVPSALEGNIAALMKNMFTVTTGIYVFLFFPHSKASSFMELQCCVTS